MYSRNSIALESFDIIFEMISWLPITLTDFQSVGAHDPRIQILENSDYFWNHVYREYPKQVSIRLSVENLRTFLTLGHLWAAGHSHFAYWIAVITEISKNVSSIYVLRRVRNVSERLSFKLASAPQPRKHIVSTLFFLLIQILHVSRAISRI